MKLAFFVFLTMLLVFSACSADSSSGALVLTEADAGTKIEVQQGEIFNVTLQGNQTTGYNWMIKSIDPAILELQGDPVYTPDSDAAGSPGTMTMTFKAVAPGETTLGLEYQRPWAETVPPEKTFEVTIVVK